MPESEEANPQAPQKGMSFEELLREIRDSQKPLGEERLPKKTTPKPVPVPVEMTKAKPVVRKPVLVEEDDEEARYYEGAFGKNKSNPYQAYNQKAITELQPIVNFDYGTGRKTKVNPYADLLKNPKTLKEAVVVSEILKPKYF